MKMIPPKQRDLSTYADQFLSKIGDGFSTIQWEICVPQKHCLLWSIVLSYLRTANFRGGDFYERLSRLTGNMVESKNLVKTSVFKFNPFQNMHACFFDKTLKNVIGRLEDVFQKASSSLEEENEVNTTNLQLFANLLKSKIVLINYCSDYARLFEPNDEPSVTTLTLFKSDFPLKNGTNSNRCIPRFTFGLGKEISCSLQEIALKKILESGGINKEERIKICDLVRNQGKTQNFVTTLLKSELSSLVSEIFMSPYVVSKLANAGYVTDPRELDADGLSAFYHASLSSNNNVLYVLYSYAANTCYETESSYRDPDSCIVSNFQKLEKIIQSDISTSKQFDAVDNNGEHTCMSLEELFLFNTCLSEISQDIYHIRQGPDNSSFEVAKQKRIILSILKVYQKFYTICNNSAQNNFSLTNYMKYKTYYNYLDITFTLLFFDNIFLLKGMLLLPQKTLYSDLESSFLLAALCNKYFLSESQNIICRLPNSRTNLNELFCEESRYNISMLERYYLWENIRNFYAILNGTEITQSNIVQRVPSHEMSLMLANWPEIRDELLICRLCHYMNIALKPKLKGVKLKLVIERTLQVIGESLKADEKFPLTIRHLLRSCVPEELLNTLTRVRNKLSHLKSYEFGLKFQIEKDDEFFRAMQSELQEINKAFKLVFEVQKMRLMKFLTNRGLEILKKEKKVSCGVNNESDDCDSFAAEEIYLNDPSHRKISFYCFQKKHPYLKMMMDNLLNLTKTRLQANQFLNETAGSNDLVKTTWINILWPLEHILLFLKDTCKFEDEKDFLGMMEIKENINRTSSLEIARNQVHDFIKISENFIKNFHISETTSRKVGLSGLLYLATIKEFEKIITGNNITEEEQENIFQTIPQNVREKINRTETLKLHSAEALTLLGEIEIETLFLNEKQKKQLQKIDLKTNSKKALRLIRAIENPIEKLKLIFDKKYVPESKVEKLCDSLEFPNNVRTKLLEAVRNMRKVKGDNLYNLLDRINKLKDIAIMERSEIRELWANGKSQKTKQHTVHKIVLRYFSEPEFQASLEMLLFDCITILEEPEEFKTLWTKNSHLFNGIDVRNVLAHGDPLLETVGNLLDPKDLPSELVTKMLQLFDDENAIKAIHDLWVLKKNGFKAAIENATGDEKLDKLRYHILECERSKTYIDLITDDQCPITLPANTSGKESSLFEEDLNLEENSAPEEY